MTDKNTNINNRLEEGVNQEFTSSSLNTKNGKISRRCAGCGKILPREQLLRITKCYKTGEIIVSPDSKQFGRSVYLCYNSECLKTAIKKKRLQKALRSQISSEILEKIEKKIYLPNKCTKFIDCVKTI